MLNEKTKQKAKQNAKAYGAGNADKRPMGTDIKVFLVACAVIAIGITITIIYLLSPKAVTVATIDKSSIDSYEFQYYLSQNVSTALQYKTDPNQDNNTYLNQSYGSGTLKDALKQQSLSQAMQVEVLLAKAKENGFHVPAGDLNDAWNSFVSATLQPNATSQNMSLADFSKAAMGVTLNEAERVYKEYVLSQKYFEAEAGKLKVDDKTLKPYYEANKKSLDHATVRHILVTCDKTADEATVAEKKKLAEDILAKVNEGQDFSALAKQYSEDPGSKDNGGVYDIKNDGQMVPEFEDWTFSHKAGDTGIIKSDYGFHVMKLDSISNTYDSEKKDAEQAYRDSTYQKTVQDLINSEKDKIQVKDAYNNF